MAKARNPQTPQKATVPDTQGKRVQFDRETWQTLDLMARDRMMTFQELADEAFRDLLKKHGRPMDTLDAFKKSARAIAANDAAKPKTTGPKTTESKKRKPAGSRRAR